MAKAYCDLKRSVQTLKDQLNKMKKEKKSLDHKNLKYQDQPLHFKQPSTIKAIKFLKKYMKEMGTAEPSKEKEKQIVEEKPEAIVENKRD